MSISINFWYNFGHVDNDKIIVDGIDPNTTTVNELLMKFFEKINQPLTTDPNKIAFVCGGIVLNSAGYLNRTLSSIKLTKTCKKIIIRDLNHLVG